MTGDAKCRNWGGLESQGHWQNNNSIDSAYDFLFNFKGNYASILYRYRVTASYSSKVANINPPNLRLSPP